MSAEHAEIEEAVGKELGAMGIAGTLVVAGKSIELRPIEGGAPVEIEIEQVLSQWPLLPAELRKRKSFEVAQRIAGAHRFARRVEGKTEGPAVDPSWRRFLGGVLALFGLLALLGVMRYAVPRVTGDPPPEPDVKSESAEKRKARLDAICKGMRNALYDGKSFEPLSTEGWVIELWLASKKAPVLGHPALEALAPGGKLAPSADAEIAAIRDGAVEIVDGLGGGAAQRSPGWNAATITFREGYTRPFFSESLRPRFVALAERTAAATGADHAALYARCDYLPERHDVGAWFLGPDMAGAAATLVYQLGFFAESWRVDTKALVASGSTNDLDALRKLAGDLGDAAAKGAVGAAGASVTTAHGATVVFPFSPPVRSVTAARDLAQRMGIAVVGGK